MSSADTIRTPGDGLVAGDGIVTDADSNQRDTD
jgi:hypothetical protein